MTVWELLAASPDAWKIVKDEVMTQQKPIANVSTLREMTPEEEGNAVSTFLSHEQAPGSLVVASSIEDLQTIPLVLNEQETMMMESMNAMREALLGLLHDLPVRIGQNTFYLQVQVVENASYEMLLGRPFLTLTEAHTHHYSSGNSHITLQDPNTHDIFTVPTKPHVCQMSGFQ
ncbi:hypothetical protein P691DRAFT_799071 [Macrolepiota fuliginosa MF-IS2]|uniref:Uncharacterized protein n=1 Tax=Macrolepiota fuliginosa MF-IS2 TaxID=1400762 RepID=A0A9P5X1S5_9AGAR|nr:hypothetical protein P691DRAFT_799071 [Macrolepiota fuliginosa MF-IS2]